MLKLEDILENHYISQRNSGFKQQSVNLHTAIEISEGINDLHEIYETYPYKTIVRCFEDFKDLLSNNSDIIITAKNKVSIVKKWYGQLLSDYESPEPSYQAVAQMRLCGDASLADVSKVCKLTQESIRQREISIQRSILSENIARIYLPELFLYDYKYLEFLRRYSFSYEIAARLYKISPAFDSARRYYHYVEKRSIKTLSKWCFKPEYIDDFCEYRDMLEELDPEFSPEKYGMYEVIDDNGNVEIVQLTPKNLIRDLLRKINEPIHPRDFQKIYSDYIKVKNLPKTFNRPVEYLSWGLLLADDSVIRTTKKKIRYYDFDKYGEKLDELFSIAESIFEKYHNETLRDKFLIRDTGIKEIEDKLKALDIQNEFELHSLLKYHYKGSKFTFGRCPVILWTGGENV